MTPSQIEALQNVQVSLGDVDSSDGRADGASNEEETLDSGDRGGSLVNFNVSRVSGRRSLKRSVRDSSDGLDDDEEKDSGMSFELDLDFALSAACFSHE